MTREEIYDQIKQKKSFLCIGLDTDLEKIPKHLLSYPDPVFEFNKQIIDATHDLCVAYKINTAFYEANGVKGWESMKKTFDYIPKDIFTIADAKRGDIGNTSAMYARAFFEREKSGFDFDAVTVAPYMGEDSVTPFLQHKNKWVILLALTSNKGAEDFQLNSRLTTRPHRSGTHDSPLLYEEVILKSQKWATPDNMMYVIGATHPEMFAHVRTLAPDHFFLVPGVGAQGGDLKMVAQFGMNKQCGLLVNVSRNIIYASSDNDFAKMARGETLKLQKQMNSIISSHPA